MAVEATGVEMELPRENRDRTKCGKRQENREGMLHIRP